MSSRKVLITGVSGYFGRVLLPLLEEDQSIQRLIGIDRRPLPADLSSTKMELHQIDLRSPGWEGLFQGVDTVVHFSFILMRLPNGQDPDEINLQTSRRVFNAAAGSGVRKLIVASSVVAYGLHADNPIPLTEESPLRPNPGLYYGRAKAANEAFLDQLESHNNQMLVTRLRPCTVIGPHADPAQMASLTGKTAVLVRGFNPPIQLVHEQDVASAFHLAIQKDLPGIYNVTSDEPRTLQDLVALQGGRALALPYWAVRGTMGLLWRLKASVFAPEWVDLSRFPLVASNEKLRTAGWEPRYTTTQAFMDLLSSRGAYTQENKPDPGRTPGV